MFTLDIFILPKNRLLGEATKICFGSRTHLE